MKRISGIQLSITALQPETEATLIKKVRLFLENNGYRIWRQNNTGRFDKNAARNNLIKKFREAVKGNVLTDAMMQAIIDEVLQKSWRKVDDTVRGVPDCIGYNKKNGKWIGVEIKIGTDSISEHQSDFMNDLMKAGGEMYVVRDFDKFQELWERRNKYEQARNDNIK